MVNIAGRSDEEVAVQLSSTERGIIKTLLYFDIFRHPLTKEELFLNHPDPVNAEEIEVALKRLLSDKMVYGFDDFYLLKDDKEYVHARIKANRKGLRYQKLGTRISRLISSFPYVRAVALSGSVSKGVVGNKGDIDYFIITEPGRLWICRTFLIAFKKLFLFNSRKYFCLNYFIDIENLVLTEKNIFTATELMHLYPTVNSELLEKLIIHNSWAGEFYPNRKGIVNNALSGNKSGSQAFKKAGEWLLSGTFGDWLESFFHRITLSKWEKKFRTAQGSSFEVNFRSTKGVSKHHPLGFQYKVTDAYNKRIRSFEESYKTSLT